MPATATEIVSAAIQLPEAERIAIVSQLLETMGDEEHLPDVDDEGFIDEMQRRRHDAAGSIPWSQLRDEN
ncbi:MAG: hypothetical protein WCO86_15280 [Planctomycetota bacterium]|jgi:hypothetical protein